MSPTTRPKHWALAHWPLLCSALLLIVLVALYFAWPAYQEQVDTALRLLREGDAQGLRDWVAGFGALGPLIVIAMMVVQMFLVVVPSWLLMFLAVLAYGPWTGTLLAIVAVAAASAVGYGIGHVAGTATLQKLLGEKTSRRVQEQTDRYGLWAVVVTRLNPLLSNDAISFVGGMLHMGFFRFMLATLVGITPLAIAIAVLGEQWEDSKALLIGLSLACLAGLVIKVVFDHRVSAKGSGDDT